VAELSRSAGDLDQRGGLAAAALAEDADGAWPADVHVDGLTRPPFGCQVHGERIIAQNLYFVDLVNHVVYQALCGLPCGKPKMRFQEPF